MSRILVVDDEPAIRTFLVEGLTDAGYSVCTASNGAEALQRAGEYRSDVVLLDLLMPVMDGLAFLRERLLQPDLARVPVVVLTAAGMETLRAATKLRASAVLSKPLDLDVLSSVLEHVLKKPTRTAGTCPICGAQAPAADVTPGARPSSQLPAAYAARLKHVLSHSAEEIARVPMRQQLLQLPLERRYVLTDWLYQDLRQNWGDLDRRGVHSVDEALGSAAMHRLWQCALSCRFENCRHAS